MEKIFEQTERKVLDQGFVLESKDFNRPWGGFLVIKNDQIKEFAKFYFPGLDVNEISRGLKLSPKILMVAPKRKLSWQYHHRRSELWRVLKGPVGIVRSDSDEENEMKSYKHGDTITLKRGERHRLVGLSSWGVVAELWIHSDPENPSDEEDIIRVQDDFNRKR